MPRSTAIKIIFLLCTSQYVCTYSFESVYNLTIGNLPSSVSVISALGLSDGTVETFSESASFMSTALGFSETCPFRENISASVKSKLRDTIKGQGEAIDIISNAIASWELSRRGGFTEPLLLAISGSTGIGKTETAYRLAEALLAKQSRIGSTRRTFPHGLLVINGEVKSLP